MLMLAASKRVILGDAAVRDGPWEWRNLLQSEDIFGRTLLQIGYGRIGRHITRMMSAFGVTSIAYDPYLQQTGWPAGDVQPVETLLEGLAKADIVSISIPGAERPIISAAELAAAKDGIILVNTARGGIVDEAALADALSSGKVGAAGLDVFKTEPVPVDNPLIGLKQVILSPHIAGLTQGSAERMAVGSAQNILDFFAGSLDPDLIVNSQSIAHV
jgi:D-3-phosphoglycerate dehydrogenase